MKHLRLLLVLFFLSLLCPVSVGVSSQELTGGFPEANLPSEQTYSNIEESSGVSKPNLRYGPGEGGDANKETTLPAGSANIYSLLLLAGVSLCAGRFMKQKTIETTSN